MPTINLEVDGFSIPISDSDFIIDDSGLLLAFTAYVSSGPAHMVYRPRGVQVKQWHLGLDDLWRSAKKSTNLRLTVAAQIGLRLLGQRVGKVLQYGQWGVVLTRMAMNLKTNDQLPPGYYNVETGRPLRDLETGKSVLMHPIYISEDD